MPSLHRIEDLRAQHRSLEQVIGREIGRPSPDLGTINDLKRKKLRIKDAIVHLEHSSH
jgi:hypothetical protein